MPTRRILRLTGRDIESFLQGLVTNDVSGMQSGLVYAALLTPQGKYIADFFLFRDDECVLLDVAEFLADDLVKRLRMYKLRADVSIENAGMHLQRGTGAAPENAMTDPRHPNLGWRAYSPDPERDDGSDWDAIRVRNCVPQSGIELTPDTFILEAGFENLHGVDFKKGCYVGQEVTARMKHKTELRKGLRKVSIKGTAPVGTPVTLADKPVGTLFTQSGGHAIAYLRLDRAGEGMQAGSAQIQLV